MTEKHIHPTVLRRRTTVADSRTCDSSMYRHVRTTGPGVSLKEPLGLAVRVAHQGSETMQLGTANPERSEQPRVLMIPLGESRVRGAGSSRPSSAGWPPGLALPTTHRNLVSFCRS
jgi:hypothetical protein